MPALVPSALFWKFIILHYNLYGNFGCLVQASDLLINSCWAQVASDLRILEQGCREALTDSSKTESMQTLRPNGASTLTY